MTRPPSIPRALDLIERVADDVEGAPKEADRHAATQAANRIMAALRSSGEVPAETMDTARDLCNRIRGAVEYAGDHPSEAAVAAGDMRHSASELRELLSERRPSSDPTN